MRGKKALSFEVFLKVIKSALAKSKSILLTQLNNSDSFKKRVDIIIIQETINYLSFRSVAIKKNQFENKFNLK